MLRLFGLKNSFCGTFGTSGTFFEELLVYIDKKMFAVKNTGKTPKKREKNINFFTFATSKISNASKDFV